MQKREKIASAVAGAIAAYLKQDEEARLLKREHARASSVGLWGQSGRQDTMSLRRLYQLRITRR